MKLSVYNKPNFVEKVLSDKEGRQFRLVFMVTVADDGRLKAKLVSAVPLSRGNAYEGASKNSAQRKCPICLPSASPLACVAKDEGRAIIPVVSPYTELLFFNSQPTRAPSF